MMPDQTYILTFSEDQAQVIVDALDLYSRMHIGQIPRALDPIQFTPIMRDLEPGTERALRRVMELAQELITGFRHGGPGIHSEQVDDRARIAYDLQQVVRHRLAWDRNPPKPSGFHGVAHDEPRQTSRTEPLPRIESASGKTG